LAFANHGRPVGRRRLPGHGTSRGDDRCDRAVTGNGHGTGGCPSGGWWHEPQRRLVVQRLGENPTPGIRVCAQTAYLIALQELHVADVVELTVVGSRLHTAWNTQVVGLLTVTCLARGDIATHQHAEIAGGEKIAERL